LKNPAQISRELAASPGRITVFCERNPLNWLRGNGGTAIKQALAFIMLRPDIQLEEPGDVCA